MALWDIFEPAELTGFARAEAELYDEASLARYLPNEFVADIAVKFMVGQTGMIPEARYRALDAEPEIIAYGGSESAMVELPAISVTHPISEYRQLRTRNASDEELRAAILKTMRGVVRAIMDRSERQRATVLVEGMAVADQSNFKFSDDFGRDPRLNVTATWNDPTDDRLSTLEALRDVYEELAGQPVGRILMDRAAFTALRRGDQFSVPLLNGTYRPANMEDVRGVLSAADLPADIEIYTRRSSAGAMLPTGTILFLPEPGAPNGGANELGATYWGQTLTAMEPSFQIAPAEQPGIVVAAYRGEKIPQIAEVMADSISLPVLGDANKSASLMITTV